MSAVTVRSLLALILENGLKMDDEIHFELSPETFDSYTCPEETNRAELEINFVATETVSYGNCDVSPECCSKKLVMVFDLDEVNYD